MGQSESAPIVGAMLLATPVSGDDALLWAPVGGRPLVAWSLAALRSAPEIGSIALVVPESRLDDAVRLIAAEGMVDTSAFSASPGVPLAAALDLTRVDRASETQRARHVARRRWQEETEAVEQPGVIVLHDAARPLIAASHLAALIASAADAGLAVSAEPVTETIKRVAEGRVVETLPRDELARLVPPLAVRADVLPALLTAAAALRLSLMQPMDLVVAAPAEDIVVRAVTLTGPSLAIMTPEDLAVAEALLQLQQ